MVKRSLVALCALLITSVSYGAALDPSESGLAARQLGIGSAGLTLTDINSVFINPAGIEGIKPWGMSATSSTLLGEIRQNIFAGVYRTDWGTVGLGYVDLSLDGAYSTVRDPSAFGRIIINPSVEAAGYDNNALLLSYARRISYKGDLVLGASLKFFNQSISGGSASNSKGSATDVDLGAIYTPEWMPWVSTGAVIQNFLSSSVSWSGASSASEKLPGRYRLGLRAAVIGKGSWAEINELDLPEYYGRSLDVYFDSNMPSNDQTKSSLYFNTGVEWRPVQDVALRLGLDQRNGGTNINYGVGLEKDGFRFDYALRNDPISDAATHVFSMSFWPVPKKPLPLKKAGEYTLNLSSPLEKSSVTGETTVVKGSVANAYSIHGLAVNGKHLSPFVSGNSFETAWGPLAKGLNVISIEAFITSPEAGSASGTVNILVSDNIPDVRDGYFASNAVRYMQALDIMKGYSDGKFKPESPITRAELVTMLTKAKGIPSGEGDVAFIDFKDTKGHWASRYINLAVREKMVGGYSDGTYRPKRNVSRAEAAVIMTRFEGMKLVSTESSPFSDVPSNHWAQMYITGARDAGMLDYLPKTASFEAKTNVTRGEIAYMLSKTALIKEKIDSAFKSVRPASASTERDSVFEFAEPLPLKTDKDKLLLYGRILSKDVKDVLINDERFRIFPPSSGQVFSREIPLKTGINEITLTFRDKGKKVIKTYVFKAEKI